MQPLVMKIFTRLVVISLGFLLARCTSHPEPLVPIQKDDRIALVGGNLGSRMKDYGHFETELQLRFPDSTLIIRNLCDGGDTPGFRPHSGRATPWAFPTAEAFQDEFAHKSGSQGHFEYPDEWLTRLAANTIIGFFGFSESFAGEAGLDAFRSELTAFVKHTKAQNYDGSGAPRLVLVSPIAFEDLSDRYDLPDGIVENHHLAIYSETMKEVAATEQIPFVDAFHASQRWLEGSDELTIDGSQLNDEGYKRFSTFLVNQIYGGARKSTHEDLVQDAVMEKNWLWQNDYKIPNGVHVFGRRYAPFGPDNYPFELKKIREMTDIRDQAIWQATRGEKLDLAAADAKTSPLPAVETNYQISNKNGTIEYLYGEDALAELEVADGFKVELFASEEEFEDLANPVQMSFDDRGRLWVGCMPSYPHYRPGDSKPDDKLIILEDTDGDGKADKQTTFADGLSMPIGFEFAPEGVYVSQGTNLVLLKDDDGDDKYDSQEILLSGFDDHDTHHAISAFCADPSGAIYMAEGVFLHTNVETSYGTVRGTNGGFYRYSPQRKHLERTTQVPIPNPWGIAFDEWGQPIFAETSGPDIRWMIAGSVKSRYGVGNPKGKTLVHEDQRVRPTSGLEFVHSRHFPDEMQGDMLINNTIGFLGTKQHQMLADSSGFKTVHRQDLIVGKDKNFRPVDMEFAPDGSLYMLDWHNVLIGHMQHNARDPLRDHVHGRIYRITYPSRPLVEPAKVHDATIPELLDNLKLPEYRTRYRSRRVLRGRDHAAVKSALESWIADLDQSDPQYEHHLLEALWVTWGLNDLDQDLLRQLLGAKDFRARAAVTQILRYAGHQVEDQEALLTQAAADEHSRVRLMATVAASWIEPEAGLRILNEVEKHPMDSWLANVYENADAHLHGHEMGKEEELILTALKGKDREMYVAGKEIYLREGFCGTCHQEDGRGLLESGYPPLVSTRWVLGNVDRLIKLTMNGLHGPIEVLGKNYPGQVPMMPYGMMLKDDQIASVLTYVRNSFGNTASVVKAEDVARVREEIKDKKGFYSPQELLEEHPHEEEIE